MNCPGCGAPMEYDKAKQRLVCGFCGGAQMLQPDGDGVAMIGGESPLECPVCAARLARAAIGDYELLCCPRCQGLLVSMGEFLDLLWSLQGRAPSAGPRRAFDPKQLDRVIACPQCQHRMDTHLYAGPGGVVIDSCSACNLDWLDRGELARIARAPDHSVVEDE